MQQTYNDTTISRLSRWICRKGELAAIIGLMASSACYGLFALAHMA